MKSGDKLRTMVLRGVLTEVSRFEVEKDVRREADEAAIVQILKREKARREETLMFARKGARQDLIDQNEAELKIIEGYLPAGISADELRAAIKEEVAGSTPASPTRNPDSPQPNPAVVFRVADPSWVSKGRRV